MTTDEFGHELKQDGAGSDVTKTVRRPPLMVKSLVESHHGERATKLIFADRLERFLTATFTAASTLVPTIPPTSYSIDFTGAGTQLYYYNSPTKTDVLIPLATSSPTQVPSYTQLDGTVLVTQAPEPKSLTLILLILGFFISFQVLGKFKPAPAANLSA